MQYRIINIALRARGIERRHIRSVQGCAGPPSFHQVGIGKERPAHGNEVAFLRRLVVFSARGIIAAGMDLRALEQFTECLLHGIRHQRRAQG